MKRVILSFVLCGITFTHVLAQQSSLDSLRQAALIERGDSSAINASISLTALYSQNDIDSATFFANRAIIIAEELDDPFYKARTRVNLAQLYLRIGDYGSALTELENIQEDAARLEDQSVYAEVLRTIGNIGFIQYNYETAEQYLKDAEKIYEELRDTSRLSNVYDNLANVYLETARSTVPETDSVRIDTTQMDKAILYYNKALDIKLKLGNPMNYGGTYINLSIVYNDLGDLDKAGSYSKLALEIAEENNALLMATYPLRTLGHIALKKGELQQALDYSKRSLEIAEELDLIYERKDAHANLSRIYESLKNYELAYFHYYEEKELNDELLKEDANQRLSKLRAELEDQEKQQQIRLLESEQKLKDTRFFAITTSLGLLLALVALGGARVISQKQKRLIESERDKLIIENEKQVAQEKLKNEELRNEHLQKGLTNYALQIVEKNEFLEQVKSDISTIKSEVKSEDAVKDINKLGSRIYQNLMIDQQREEFEHTVNELCSSFFNTLDTKYPDLTRQEKRLASLLRLDLSSKDIAGILNITPKSVDQSRYRLRKKLDLDKERNLVAYLNQL